MEIHITSQSKKVVFSYKGNRYTYLYESDAMHGFGYIKNQKGETIFGPYPKDVTDEGKAVYGVFWEEYLKKAK